MTKPIGDDTIEAIVSNHLFALIGDMRAMAANQSKASKISEKKLL